MPVSTTTTRSTIPAGHVSLKVLPRQKQICSPSRATLVLTVLKPVCTKEDMRCPPLLSLDANHTIFSSRYPMGPARGGSSLTFCVKFCSLHRHLVNRSLTHGGFGKNALVPLRTTNHSTPTCTSVTHGRTCLFFFFDRHFLPEAVRTHHPGENHLESTISGSGRNNRVDKVRGGEQSLSWSRPCQTGNPRFLSRARSISWLAPCSDPTCMYRPEQDSRQKQETNPQSYGSIVDFSLAPCFGSDIVPLGRGGGW